MGIRTVAVHSTADADAMHVRLADEAVCIGPPSAIESYLNIPTILAAAEITGSDGIHPGYGFLSENADFAQIVEEHGYTFIGPSEQHIKIMGDKIQAKKTVRELGINVMPGSDGAITDPEEAKALKYAPSEAYPGFGWTAEHIASQLFQDVTDPEEVWTAKDRAAFARAVKARMQKEWTVFV
jgi:acetyl-CoA carboxylase biotin carboxylase subunit